MQGRITYRQQYTRCGKERCRKCKEGMGHGPYWYAFWSESGRTVSKYIGVHLPAEIAAEMQVKREKQRRVDETLLAGAPGELKAVSPFSLNNASVLQNVPFLLDSQVLRIYTLGQLRIERLQGETWSPIENRFSQRRRALTLLGCLVSNPGRRAGREQIMEALWPDLDIDTATNRLNGSVHELRQILEPAIDRPAASRMLRLERDILVLADRSDIWVDAEAFESLINEAHQIGTQDVSLAEVQRLAALLEVADRLYAGDYLLEELYAEWAAPRRDALKRNWISLQLKLSELLEVQSKPVNAMEPLNRLLAADPTNETAVQRLMRLLTGLDRRGEALSAYRRLAVRLRQLYESDPLPETRALYDKLRQGHAINDTPPSISIKQTVKAQDKPSRPGNEGAGNGQPVDKQLDAEHAARTLAALRAASSTQFGRANQSPLVGREQEILALRQLLHALEKQTSRQRAGTPAERAAHSSLAHALHLALLTGEAGIGKTRLAEELSHEAVSHGWIVAWAHSYEQEGAIPYRPWIEVLRTFMPYLPFLGIARALNSHQADEASVNSHIPTPLERLSTLLPDLRRLLAQTNREYPPLPPEQERLHLWEAMLELLSALSNVAPLLLVLDDLHWMDDSSREMLAYLVRHLREQRILVVGTCRDVELAPKDSLRTLITDLRRERALLTLAVQPLSRSQIGSLVAHLPQNIVQDIQTRAGGNPFFAEEMARVSESAPYPSLPGIDQNDAAHPPLQGEQVSPLVGGILPEGIAAVLERRLSRLSDDCQALLGKAAVLGGAFAPRQLLAMAPEQNEDSLLDLLDEALRAGLLTEEGAGTRIIYHFWHPLIVSHLYERLSAARRAQLHRRAASSLMQTSNGREHEAAAVITHHLSKGGGDPDLIAWYAELAANQSYSLAAYAEARQYYLQAIQTITGGSVSRADVSSRPESDLLRVARLLEFVGECASVLGSYEEARTYFEQALELHQLHTRQLAAAELPQEAQIQAMLWRGIGRTWSWNGNYEQAHLCYQRGKQALEEAGITSGAAWACVHLEYGRIGVLEGNYDEARLCITEALAMLEQVLAELPVEESPVAEAQVAARVDHLPHPTLQTEIERAIAGDPLEVGRALELLGLVAAHTGQYTEALEYLFKALALFEQHDLVIAMVKVCGNIGAVYLTRADNTRAQPYMHRALELAERMGNAPMIAFVTGNLGEQATRSGNLLEAEEWFRRSLAVAERVNEPEHISWCNVALAGTLQDLGQIEGAAACVQRALLIGRAMKSNRNLSGALVALGDLRVTQAIIACRLAGRDLDGRVAVLPPACRRQLLSARSSVQHALALEGRDVETEVEGRLVLASIHFMLGDLPQAEEVARQTLKDAAACELTRLHARALRLLGRILSAQRQYEQADAYFEESLAAFRRYEMRLDYARAQHGYAVTRLDRAAPGSVVFQKALAALREAGEIFAACHAAADLQWVELELLDLFRQGALSA